DSVVDRPAVVRPGGGVEHEPVGEVEGLVQPVDVDAFLVGLPAADGHAEILRPGVDPRLQLAEREAPLGRRVAAAEVVEVDAVQDLDSHARMLVARAARTSSSGSSTPRTGLPGAWSSTSLIRPSSTFLSRCIASHARSRSTATGWGSSTF